MLKISSLKNPKFILFTILLVGGLLRLYGLGFQSLWNDELISWRRSNFDTISEVIKATQTSDVHPPGYQIILYGVEKTLGDSESMLRLPSALAGIISIYVIFLIGSRLFSKKEGLLSALIMGILWCPLYYSQEARAYSLLLLFSLITIYLWIKIIDGLNNNNLNKFIRSSYVVTAIITSYLHYFGAFFIGIQGVIILLIFLTNWKNIRILILLYLVIGVSYFPWLPSLYLQIKSPVGGHIKSPGIDVIYGYVKYIFNGHYVFILLVSIFVGYLVLNYFIRSFKMKEINFKKLIDNYPELFLIGWFAVPFLLAFLISNFATPIFTYRNLIIIMPAAFILLARSIITFPIQKKLFIILPLIILFLGDLIIRKEYYSKPHKQQFREVVNYVIEKENKYTPSNLVGYVWHPKYLEYYFEREHSDRKVDKLVGEEKHIPYIDEYLNKMESQYLWYISAHRKPHEKFINALYNKLNVIENEKFIGAEVWLFSKKVNLNP